MGKMSKAREQIAKLDYHQNMPHACTGCCRSYEYWCERLLDAIEEALRQMKDDYQTGERFHPAQFTLERALEGKDEA